MKVSNTKKVRMNGKKKVGILAAALVGLTLSAAPFVVSANTDQVEDSTKFLFSDTGITAEDGAFTDYAISGTSLTIKSAGTYLLSGNCANGNVTVKKGTTGVTLVLNGLTLHSEDTAPIACNKSSGVTILAADGTVNTLTDSSKNNDDNYPENENAENAVIKCKDGSNVSLTGGGTLNVVANGKNGIKLGESTEEEGEASLTISDLTLNVTSNENDGINASSTLNLLSGKVTVSAADDGIKSDYTLNIGALGSVGPDILVMNSYEGIEGAEINVYSGDVVVHSSEDGINAANSDLTNYAFNLNIAGGKVYVDAATGDGIDSNGALSISGGTVEVYSASSGDNSPLDADGKLTLSGGTVLAVGAPGMSAAVSGNAVTFGAQAMGMQMGQNNFAPQANNAMGGNSMGNSMNRSMGNPMGNPMSNAMNNAMGGAMGNPMGGAMGGNLAIAAGDSLEIADGEGNTVYSATAVRSASYVLFSADELKAGEAYSLLANGKVISTTSGNASAAIGGESGGNFGEREQNEFGGQFGGQLGESEQDEFVPQMGEGFGPQMNEGFGPQMNEGFGPQMNEGFAPQMNEGFAPQMNEGFGPQMNEGFAPQMNEGFGPQMNEGFAPQMNEGFGPQMGEGFAPQMNEGFGPQMNEGFCPQMGEGFAPQMNEGFAPQMNEGFAPQMNEGFAPQMNEGFGPQMNEGFGPQMGEGFAPQTGEEFTPQNEIAPEWNAFPHR